MISDSMPVSMPASLAASARDNALVSNVSPVLAQQRHIMALMGLDIWVQRDTATLNVDYEVMVKQQQHRPVAMQPTDKETQAPVKSESVRAPDAAESPASDQPSAQTTNPVIENEQATHQQPVADHQQPVSLKSGQINTKLRHNPIEVLKEQVVEKPQHSQPTVKQTMALEQVDPFHIVGVHYHDWVLLADINALSDTAHSQLWESILNGLSLKAQHQKFPICEGIMDIESANASVAGFVFYLAKTDTVKVATLTEMPTGIIIDQRVTAPSLTDMLTDGTQKAVLWQLLNN